VSLLSASSNMLCINLQFITSWGKTHWVCYTDHICQCIKSDWDTQWHEMPETLNHASAWTLVLCFLSLNSRMQESHTCAHPRKGMLHSSPGVVHSDQGLR
jgi:hypothetical protein